MHKKNLPCNGLYFGERLFGDFDDRLLLLFGDDVGKADSVNIASYVFGDKTYNVTAPRERPYLIKLADYGTADISPETLGSEITMAQFTTFENVAPDFYILGMLS